MKFFSQFLHLIKQTVSEKNEIHQQVMIYLNAREHKIWLIRTVLQSDLMNDCETNFLKLF